MILAIVGSGGKTTLLKTLAARYRACGKSVFVTTTTHMFIEEDTLLTDDPAVILAALRDTGYVMAGIPEGPKIRPLSPATYEAVCAQADAVLVEADGSRHMPLKFPGPGEPVIPANAEQILVVCGLNALGKPAGEVCHRLELVTASLGIREDTPITPAHIQQLVTQGYLLPLRQKYPRKQITLLPRHDGSPYQKALAEALQKGEDVSALPCP